METIKSLMQAIVEDGAIDNNWLIIVHLKTKYKCHNTNSKTHWFNIMQ